MEYMYHGTIDKFVPSILANGLQSVRENGWDADKVYYAFEPYNPMRDDEPGNIFLTDNILHAIHYANGKVEYFKTNPGKLFKLNWIGGHILMQKGRNTLVIPDAKPVILKIMKTNELESQLQPDYHDGTAFCFRGSIEPSLILPLTKLGKLNYRQ